MDGLNAFLTRIGATRDIALAVGVIAIIGMLILPMPGWLREGLRYAPLAALAAVVAPEVVMTQGRLIDTWRDARLFAVAAATVYYFWRRDILGTIVTGTAAMLALRLVLGW